MRVTFTRVDRAHYRVAVDRDRGPRLAPRLAPGYDDYMPHDLAHFLVELEFGIRLGVFGQLAAGGSGIFAPVPAERTGRARRSDRRLAGIGRADMARSEALVHRCVSEWARRAGRPARLPAAADRAVADPQDVERTVRRLAAAAKRWHALGPGGSLTFSWPGQLTFDPAGSHAGRQVKDVPAAGPRRARDSAQQAAATAAPRRG